MTTSRTICAAAVAIAMLGACARTPAPVVGPGGVVTTRSAIQKAREDSIRLPYTQADIKFMTDMIGHHAQAIVMSNMVPSRSTNPSVRTLAERIINAQQDEILAMQRWLLNRNQPVPVPSAGGHDMSPHNHAMGSDMSSMASMPGMLSPQQLAQLDSARGQPFDELFVTYMIQHHKGAVSMVKDLFAQRGAGQDETVFKFASDVNVDQTTEIARMERMLVSIKFERKSP